jgi:hypothetical protein
LNVRGRRRREGGEWRRRDEKGGGWRGEERGYPTILVEDT